MKKFRRTASLLLAIAMVFALSVTAFAAEPGASTTGTITITNAKDGNTYSAYRIFILESYNADASAYSYKVDPKWKSWVNASAGQYVTVNDGGYVAWVGEPSEERAAEFAKLALDHAKTASITVDKTAVAVNGEAQFTDLLLGYYLVDSPMGALCVLDTTDNSVSIKEKNENPTIDKQVQEDSKLTNPGGGWGKDNDADIGQTVNFKTTVYAQPGAENYVVHDKMSAGLTFNRDIAISVGDTPVDSKNYTVKNQSEPGSGITDDCTFEITFMPEYLNTITAPTDIVITYSATLNKDAVIAGDVNTNKTQLTYGDMQTTEWIQTTTKTYQFQLVKTDEKNQVLEGAEFDLYDAPKDGTMIELVKIGEGTYRVATEADKTEQSFTSAKIQAGQATIQGLDGNTTYYLQETKAPDGYNKLKDRHEVPLQEANLDATVNAGTDVYEKGGVHVINKTGAELPSTGGIGTTVFYVVGGVMVAAAVILLITKKRMGSAE